MLPAEIQVKEPHEPTSHLVQRAKDGCSDAFAALVQKYQLDIRAFLRRRIPDASVADDLAQDVFLTAVRNISQLVDHESVKSWLLAIARNKSVDYLRRMARQKSTSADELETLLAKDSLTRIDSADSLRHGELVAALKQCISQLKPNAKKIVDQFYFDNKTAEQVATESQLTGSAIRMSLLRIRKGLAKCIRLRMGENFQL